MVDFISARLDQGMSPSQASSALLDACLANDPKEARGVGCDNMTSVVVLLKATNQVGGQFLFLMCSRIFSHHCGGAFTSAYMIILRASLELGALSMMRAGLPRLAQRI